jgi:hypothetical protein
MRLSDCFAHILTNLYKITGVNETEKLKEASLLLMKQKSLHFNHNLYY